MMRVALSLGRRGLGRVWPNPAVGCVITDSVGAVVGRGWTQASGRPHAETEALRRAGDRAHGGTAFVTLEPCSHQGQTPPCAQALIDAGITRVVAAIEDPDSRVAGRGVAMLKDVGIDVALGVESRTAAFDQAGFLSRIERGRPLFALKSAMSLDGRIAASTGHSQWITGAASRRRGHLLRAEYDAILVGIGTASADDPALSCRIPGLTDASPVRILVDSTLRIDGGSDLVVRANVQPTWIACLKGAAPERRDEMARAGVRIFETTPDASGRVNLEHLAEMLGGAGLTRVLIEGGGMVAASFLQADLIDRMHVFRASTVIGGDGHAAIGPLGLARVDEAPSFIHHSSRKQGADLEDFYIRA